MTDNQENQNKEFDPLRLRKVSLTNDFYTLCWTCLRKDIWDEKADPDDEENPIWEEKTIGGEKLTLTSDNFYKIKLYMVIFIVVILYVLVGILVQVFTGEIQASCNWDIRILRILLVSLVQMKLLNEFRQGIIKYKYANYHADEFIDLWWAKFIPLCQIICTFLSWITLCLFICSEVEPLDMIQDFTGICVFTELDDWIGSQICATEPNVPEEDLPKYDFSNINERISLSMKMSKVQYDTDIVEDLRDYGDCTLKKLVYSFYSHKIYVYLIPLICIPIEFGYLKWHPKAV